MDEEHQRKEISDLLCTVQVSAGMHSAARSKLYATVKNHVSSGGNPETIAAAVSDFKTEFEHFPAVSLGKDDLRQARKRVQSCIAYVNRCIASEGGGFKVIPVNRPRGAKAHTERWVYDVEHVPFPATVLTPAPTPPASTTTGGPVLTNSDVLKYIHEHGLKDARGISIHCDDHGYIKGVGSFDYTSYAWDVFVRAEYGKELHHAFRELVFGTVSRNPPRDAVRTILKTAAAKQRSRKEFVEFLESMHNGMLDAKADVTDILNTRFGEEE